MKAESKKQIDSLKTELEKVSDENVALKERLNEIESQLEESRTEKEKEVGEILQKYQDAVKKMQNRLK